MYTLETVKKIAAKHYKKVLVVDVKCNTCNKVSTAHICTIELLEDCSNEQDFNSVHTFKCNTCDQNRSYSTNEIVNIVEGINISNVTLEKEQLLELRLASLWVNREKEKEHIVFSHGTTFAKAKQSMFIPKTNVKEEDIKNIESAIMVQLRKSENDIKDFLTQQYEAIDVPTFTGIKPEGILVDLNSFECTDAADSLLGANATIGMNMYLHYDPLAADLSSTKVCDYSAPVTLYFKEKLVLETGLSPLVITEIIESKQDIDLKGQHAILRESRLHGKLVLHSLYETADLEESDSNAVY
jgi:hypothetical protein